VLWDSIPRETNHGPLTSSPGLINNVLYVIILSAALDLVGPAVPKGVVLLADIVPGFTAKLVAPYFIHVVPYNGRVSALAAISACGMLLIALTPASRDGGTIMVRMVGVMLASLSTGGGELSFLGLTHYYGHFSLAAWASGTGGAGLVGAALYLATTTWAGLSERTSLLAFSFLPVVMVVSFFLILPHGPLKDSSLKATGYEIVDSTEPADIRPEDEEDSRLVEYDGLLSNPESLHMVTSSSTSPSSQTWQRFEANIRRARSLFFPYMVPLFLVYVAEYTINQGVAPTLLFPLDSSPFHQYRSFYPTYNAIYQTGVFISRTSITFLRVRDLYTPSILQLVNLFLLTLHALCDFLPSVWVIFVIIFWEGLLGGLVYANAFAEISDNVPTPDREFSLGATAVSDSAGICMAGFLSMAFEIWLCRWQVGHGRDYCTKT
jgi:battenin